MAIRKNLMLYAAQRTQMYPFRIWGFGEAIAMDALLETSRLLEMPDFSNFVYRNIDIWMTEKPELTPADHVAPGMSLLSLYQRTGEERLLTRAGQLADLLMSLPESKAGVRYHRPDENHWCWVDCLYTDGPFLARLGNISSDSSLLRASVDYVRSYLDALLDPSDRLFYHGRDEKSRKCSPYYWGRGNGWALMGLVDVLIELPDSVDGYGEIKESLGEILQRIERLQDASGHWHTILDYPESALEPSIAVMYVYAVRKGLKRGVLPLHNAGVLELASRAVEQSVQSGRYLVSEATAVGDFNYYDRLPIGTYPWGQGPFLLALCYS